MGLPGPVPVVGLGLGAVASFGIVGFMNPLSIGLIGGVLVAADRGSWAVHRAQANDPVNAA